jgi:hypothetical protein
MPKRFLILGPNGHDSLTLFWSRERAEWVDRDDATLYGDEIWLFPPRELPVGGRGIIDIFTGQIHTPRPGRV